MMRLGFSMSASAALLAIPSSALAWKHLDPPRAWLPEDMPLEYQVADDGTDDTNCQTSVPPGYCVTAAQLGYEGWDAAPCAEITHEYTGVCENIGYQNDGRNYMTYNDPWDDIPEPGTLAATLVRSSGTAFIIDGVTYAHSVDGDIVWNDNAVFDTLDNIQNGQCNGGHSMVGTSTHEIGHLLGLGHSCDEHELCTDPQLREAVMNWTGPACSEIDHIIGPDDIEGLTAIYGPFATFECSNEQTPDLAVGVVPFELKCVIVSEDYLHEVVSAEWNFGDGNTSSEIHASNVYTEAGNYTIQVTVNGERDACEPGGEWAYDFRKVGYVRACDIPLAAFTLEHIDGLTYKLRNESDVSVYGCVQDIQWDVFEGEKASGKIALDPVKAWEPEVEFPEEGMYTIVLNLGGPAGTGAAQLTFDVKNRRGEGYGCNTVASTGFGAAGFLALLGILARRRQR